LTTVGSPPVADLPLAKARLPSPVGLFSNLLLAEIYAPLEARELIRWWSLILPFPFDCKGISNLRA